MPSDTTNKGCVRTYTVYIYESNTHGIVMCCAAVYEDCVDNCSRCQCIIHIEVLEFRTSTKHSVLLAHI